MRHWHAGIGVLPVDEGTSGAPVSSGYSSCGSVIRIVSSALNRDGIP